MGEKTSLNLEKRYRLLVFKGKSYTCKNAKKHPQLCLSSVINSLEFFLFYCCVSSTFLSSFCFFYLLLFELLFVLYTMVFAPLSLSTCESGVGSFPVPSRISLNLLLLAVKLLVYCAGITSILMWPESWLGSI